MHVFFKSESDEHALFFSGTIQGAEREGEIWGQGLHVNDLYMCNHIKTSGLTKHSHIKEGFLGQHTFGMHGRTLACMCWQKLSTRDSQN